MSHARSEHPVSTASRVIPTSVRDDESFQASQTVRSLPRLVVFLLVLLAGCMHSSSSTTDASRPDAGPFGDEDAGDRETVLIEPKDAADTSYDIRPVVFDTALIRAQGDVTGAIVEVLVKGYFPDGCSELNELDQEPTHRGQTVTLTMRRPSDAICTQVIRPYRFFFTLDRRFEPGLYVLTINGKPFNFRVTAG